MQKVLLNIVFTALPGQRLYHCNLLLRAGGYSKAKPSYF